MRSMVRHREASGISQTGLAKRLSAQGLPFHPQTVQRIEAGQRPVRLNEAVLIVRALDMAEGDALGLDAAAGGSLEQALFTLSETIRAAELHLNAIRANFERDANRAAELSGAILEAEQAAEVEEGSALAGLCKDTVARLSAYVDAYIRYDEDERV